MKNIGRSSINNRYVHNRTKLFKNIISKYQLYLLLFPAFAYFAIFHFWPIYGLQIAFKQFNPGLGIAGSPWVGFDQFERFIKGPNFINLLTNTVSISFATLIFGFPIPILLALILNEVYIPGYKKLVQTVSYIPYFISTVVMVSMLMIFLNKNNGLINKILGAVGIGPYNFLSKKEWFVQIYVISGIWQSAGWKSIIYIAALAGVDPQLHEAAIMDGASRLKRIWHINIPGILPTIIIMFILATGSLMSVGFEKAYLMQQPLTLERSEVISTYVYKVGLLNVQYSFSSAVGLFNSIINFILLLSVNFICRKLGKTSFI